jgi:chromosome partitioning protein
VKPSKKLTEARFFEDVERFPKAIRGRDYDNLGILPANMTFRDFDFFLARMRNSRSRLKKAVKAVKAVKGDYDVILLDRL